MDYIRQINAFENWLEFNDLGAGPQLLWYKLMRVANISGWQNELSIANTRLISMTKSSEKTLINNRNQLIQSGLLQYKKRGRTKSGIYILTDLTTGNIPVKTTVVNTPTGKIPVDSTVNRKVNPSVDSTVNPSVNLSAYINETKLNETKDNDIDIDISEYPAEVIQRLYNKFPTGVLQGAVSDWLQYWPREMICFAIENAFDYGCELRGLKGYVSKVLLNWQQSNISTLQQAIEASNKFKNQNKNQYPNRKQPVRKEILPEWANNPPVEKEDSEVQEAMKKRLDQYLANQQREKEEREAQANENKSVTR